MKKLDHKNTIPRYTFIGLAMVALVLVIIGKALYTMTAQRDYWMKVSDQQKRDSVPLPQTRGNIFSCDGQLMASSLPEYSMFMDFEVGGEKKDSLWDAKVDSISMGLAQIFPEKTAEEFKEYLEEGRHSKKKRHWPIYKKRVTYNVFSEVKKLPIFNLPKNMGGFHYEKNNARSRPFGTLAGRTIGAMFGRKDTARFGLELSYDSVLRGTPGIAHSRKVRNQMLKLTDIPPVNGEDIVTTIDVKIQDIAEKAVVDEMREVDANVGVAIVMEVATGDIKAIVNMSKYADGTYQELQNHAVSDLMEPGSVFKTASIMVALDDGVVDTTYKVNTGNGIYPMHGREMRDHNWRRGGYGTLTVPQIIQNSSNVGTSVIIDKFYGNDPERFVQGIHRIGLAEDLHIPLVGAAKPRVRIPEKDSHGIYTNWSKTTLPWMSIGYETMIPPISTVTFYNAIANNGRMMRPRFVKQVMREGKVVREYPPQVIKEHICKESTLSKVRTMLEQVVSKGTGKKARSTKFLVAGKTGTAQVAKGKLGYHSGVMNYLLSFAGYFPADAPRYSCIVCLQKSGLPASGGMSATVFHNISEGVMAHDIKLDVSDAREEFSSPIPDVKAGDMEAAEKVLDILGLAVAQGWSKEQKEKKDTWGIASRTTKGVKMEQAPVYQADMMPDVTGMGARDAIYAIERRGVATRIIGRGKVVSQSLAAGHHINRGDTCILKFE